MQLIGFGVVALLGLASASPVNPSDAGRQLSKRDPFLDRLLGKSQNTQRQTLSEQCVEAAAGEANFCDTNFDRVPDWNYKFINCYVAQMSGAKKICVGRDAALLRDPHTAYPCPRTPVTARFYQSRGWLKGARERPLLRTWTRQDHDRCVEVAFPQEYPNPSSRSEIFGDPLVQDPYSP